MVIILTTLLMLSCFSGKLAVYLAPTFPFFVYLAVLLLSHFRWNQWLALTLLLPAVVFVAGLPALIVLGLFCAVFVGGWDVPAINGELGYSELCRKAVELSKEKNVSGYCVLNVRRSENMDVYLHERVKEVTEEEVLDNKYQNTILMISNKKIRSNKKLEEFVNGKEHYVIGRFSVMVL